MPPIVNLKKCRGCGTCDRNCPTDVMFLNIKIKKAGVIYPDECWHCGICRMDCPEGAIRIVFNPLNL